MERIERRAMKLRGSSLFWRCVGWTLFAIGFIGLFVPLLPTTIFWILAVLALAESDPTLAARIRAWPRVGPAVSNYLDHGVIAPSGKLAACAGIGVSALVLLLVLELGFGLYAALALLLAVALFILTRPSRPR